jgi:hypothetical protein
VLSYFIGMHRMEILDNLLEGDQVGQTQWIFCRIFKESFPF